MKITNAELGDSIFLACAKQKEVEKITSLARELDSRHLAATNAIFVIVFSIL